MSRDKQVYQFNMHEMIRLRFFFFLNWVVQAKAILTYPFE